MGTDKGLDDILAAISYGPWQVPVLILTILAHVVIPIHMMGSALLSAPVEFKCLPASPPIYSSNSSLLGVNMYVENTTLSTDEQNMTPVIYESKCLDTSSRGFIHSSLPVSTAHLKNLTGHLTGLHSCPWVTYDTSVFTSTIISEWDLICEKEILRPLFQMMYSIGAMIGCVLGGFVSDSFGRKRAVQIASLFNLSATVCMYVMPWYSGLLVARVFIGGSCNSMLLPAYSLALEITPPKYRTVVGMLLGTSFSMGIIIFAGIGYFIRTWRNLLMLATFIPFVVIIPLTFWIEESPRWLIQHQRGEEVHTIVVRAASKNRAKISQSLFNIIEEMRESATLKLSLSEKRVLRKNLCTRIQVTLNDIGVYFRSAAMRTIILVIPLLWIFQCCLYLGIILNANNFTSNNPFIYITVSGVIDLSSILLATPFSLKYGRRVLISTAFFLGGVFLMVDIVVPKAFLWIKWVLVMSALMLIAGGFQINFLYAPELFPTVIRARGFSLASISGNTGFLLAPLVTEVLYKQAWWSVSLTFGCAGILGSLLVPLLPETNHRPLPDTIEDVENRHRNHLARKKDKDKQYAIKRISAEAEDDTEECSELSPT